MTAAAIFEEWADALYSAWLAAKGARLAEMRGDRRVKRFNTQGLHPYSVEWGRVLACEALLPELTALRETGDYDLTPVTMSNHAAREGEREFITDVRRQAEGIFG